MNLTLHEIATELSRSGRTDPSSGL